MKSQKGITLIALVITIIVMLILVAVSVSYGIQSGLFTKARQGQASWEAEQSKESDIYDNMTVKDGTTTESLDIYINNL